VFEVTGGTGTTLVIGGSSRTTENAVVEIKQSSRGLTGKGGFLLPRMDETQRGSLSMTANDVGLIVYQSDGDEGLYIYKSGGWVQII
jgi:hypothetical protein